MEFERLEGPTPDLDEALELKRISAVAEWALFAVILVLMVLSLAGAFGGGWLADTRVADGDAAVRYERFVRFEKGTVLEVRFTGDEVAIPAAYFDDFELRQVVPAPSSERAAGDEFVFTFDTDGDRQTVFFHLTPQHPLGRTEATLRVGGASLDVAQFTYP